MTRGRTILSTMQRAEIRAENVGMTKTRDALAALRRDFAKYAGSDSEPALYRKIQLHLGGARVTVNEERDDITKRIERNVAHYANRFPAVCSIVKEDDGGVTIHTFPRPDYSDLIHGLNNLVAVLFPGTRSHLPPRPPHPPHREGEQGDKETPLRY